MLIINHALHDIAGRLKSPVSVDHDIYSAKTET